MPGDALFGPYTPPFWAAFALGGFLGIFAGRVRSVGTPFEGRPVATLLGAVAGAVAGATVFILVVAFISLLYLAGAQTNPLTVFAVTTLAQLFLFGLYMMRRR